LQPIEAKDRDRTGLSSTTDSGTTALVAKGHNQQIKSTTVTCYCCHKLGHIMRHCKEEIEAKADDKAAVAEEFSF
jgi:hypothetical protein